MSGFLYYIPNPDLNTSLESIRSEGLAYAFDRQPSVVAVQNFAPDGGSAGVLLGDADAVPVLRVQPDRQKWRKAPGAEYWVGMFTDGEAPGPSDLARPRVLGGHVIQLGDGAEWTVPVARAWSCKDGDLRWSQLLPSARDIDSNGKWVEGEVRDEYAELWRLAGSWLKALDSAKERGGDFGLDFDFILGGAIVALRANYRIGIAEAALLKLLDDALAVEVLNGVIDLPSLDAAIKKKRAFDTLSTKDGLEGETPDTDQPSRT